jgi:molybdopterin converting factor small subunit
MNVHVIIIGALSRPSSGDDFSHSLKASSTIQDLLLDLGYYEKHLNIIMSAVNGRQKRLSYKLKDGDEVELSLPVGGG